VRLGTAEDRRTQRAGLANCSSSARSCARRTRAQPWQRPLALLRDGILRDATSAVRARLSRGGGDGIKTKSTLGRSATMCLYVRSADGRLEDGSQLVFLHAFGTVTQVVMP
jgi:hypothetical protein